MKSLKEYNSFLVGCRFCPMCKPAGEVSNLTMLESHTTRARAMMLWRIASGIDTWDRRKVEILYQSTLDSISQAWCVNHYPVSEYIVAARSEVFSSGLAPAEVQQALDSAQNGYSTRQIGDSKVIFLASEVAEENLPGVYAPAMGVLEKAGITARMVSAYTGVVHYVLGDIEGAREHADALVNSLRERGVRTVIADGPQTLWTLTKVYPALGVSLPEGLAVNSLSKVLLHAVLDGDIGLPSGQEGKRVFFHDSRSAVLVSESFPLAEVIQPGYRGKEEALGKGDVYDAPRRLVDMMGMGRVFSVWSRSLSKSCGADDGLWMTYPGLAHGLARQRLDDAKDLGAEMLVTDSVLCASHLSRARRKGDVPVVWLPALIAE